MIRDAASDAELLARQSALHRVRTTPQFAAWLAQRAAE
jgi:hypothetical protein